MPSTRANYIVILVAVLLAGCATPRAAKEQRTAPPRDQSIYEPDLPWFTDAGAPLKLSALAGEPCVLSFFFSVCSFKCPITVENMRQVEASLPREARQRVRFVLVTFDPESDTVDVLRRYRTAHRLNGENWILLRGDAAAVRELARRTGYAFELHGGGGVRHDSLIMVLDSAGRPGFQHDGLYGGVNELQLAVRKMLAERP